MEVYTLGYTDIKSFGQVLHALQKLGYAVDINDVTGIDNGYVIPFKNNRDEQATLTFTMPENNDNYLASILPKVATLKHAKRYSLLELKTYYSSQGILPELLAYLGGGYVRLFEDKDSIFEVDTYRNLLPHNSDMYDRLIPLALLQMNDKYLPLLKDLPYGQEDYLHKIFNNGFKGEKGVYEPHLVYKEDDETIYVVYADNNKLCTHTLSKSEDEKLFERTERYGKEHHMLVTLNDFEEVEN